MAATPPAQSHDDATPQRMAAAGVPFELARWYQHVGRKLTKNFTERDIDKIMTIRATVALHGAGA